MLESQPDIVAVINCLLGKGSPSGHPPKLNASLCVQKLRPFNLLLLGFILAGLSELFPHIPLASPVLIAGTVPPGLWNLKVCIGFK